MNEAAFQSRIVGLCKVLRLRYHHETDSRKSKAGFPDLVIAGNGVVFAELKAEMGRVRPEQQEWHDDLKRAGAEAYIWKPSQWNEISARLRELAK